MYCLSLWVVLVGGGWVGGGLVRSARPAGFSSARVRPPWLCVRPPRAVCGCGALCAGGGGVCSGGIFELRVGGGRDTTLRSA